MVKVEGLDRVYSLTIGGKFGFPWGFGRIWFGVSRFGDDLQESGVYRRQSTPKGQIIMRENFYWPTNTLTPERELVRLIFAEGVLAWQELSEDDKNIWRALHYPPNMSGYNRFISLWLRALLP
jgi:hypothetical protein